MAHNTPEHLGAVIADTAMRAAADIIRQRNLTVDVDALCAALRKHAQAAGLRILDGGRALLDGGRAGWLETLLRAECTAAALAAVAEVSQ
jgi:hypothetical protein